MQCTSVCTGASASKAYCKWRRYRCKVMRTLSMMLQQGLGQNGAYPHQALHLSLIGFCKRDQREI